MPNDYYEIEDQIERALRVLRCQEKLNILKTAREFKVPMQRLQRCFLGTPLRCDRALINTKLSTEQEAALIKYINILIKLDIPLRLKAISNAANLILFCGHTDLITPPPSIGVHWTKCFLECYPEY